MKLITINIEGSKHLETVLPFISTELPDVLCLQEVCDFDCIKFKNLGYDIRFVPATLRVAETTHSEGVVIGVRNKTSQIQSVREYHLIEPKGVIREYNTFEEDHGFNNPCIMADIVSDDSEYRIGTTHFVWTPHGPTPTNTQKRGMDILLNYVRAEHAHVLCGDFNIPRNLNPLYDVLMNEYTDSIPKKYTSSLDGNLHRLGNDVSYREIFTSYMVDYVLTKQPFVATDVRLVFGVSDHAGVVATINTH
jgi:exonuclease III